MSSVDNRVVNMQFNNAQFEQGISQSLNSLGKLEKGLNLKSSTQNLKDLETTANKFSFAGLGNAVQSIANRFSTFGIVGMTAIQNITNTAMSAGHKLTTALTQPLIQGGKIRSQNIEQAKFQIEGLGKKWEDVEQDISYGVQDTAYGLDSAAKAASQLLASDVKLGKEMKMSLRGISGVAAMTNSSYEDISNVFTTVAGNGRLMASELNRLSARGINAAAVLAKSLGKTEAEIREMTSHSEIDFKTFAKAMDDAFGEHAKDANKTFSGALSNMKAALSRIGAEVATPVYNNLRDIFNSFTPVINTVKEGLGDYSGTFKMIEKQVSSVAKKIEKALNKFGYSVDKNGNKVYTKQAKKLQELIKTIKETVENAGKYISKILGVIKTAFKDVFPKKSISDVLKFAENIKKLTDNLKLSKKAANNLKYGFTTLFNIIKFIKVDAITVLNLLKSAFRDIFPKKSLNSFSSFKKIMEFISKIVSDFLIITVPKADKLKRIFKGIFALFSIAKNIFLKLVKPLANLGYHTHDVRTGFLEVVASIADYIVKADNAIKTSKTFGSLFENIGKGLSSISNGFKNFADKVKEAFAKMHSSDAKKTADEIKPLAEIGETIKNVFVLLRDLLAAIIPRIVQLVKSGIKAIGQFISNITNAIQNGKFDKTGKLLDKALSGGIIASLAWFVKRLQFLGKNTIFGKIKYFFGSLGDVLVAFKNKIRVSIVKEIATSIAILVGSLFVLSTIDTEDLGKGIAAMGALFTELGAFVKMLNNTFGGSSSKLKLNKMDGLKIFGDKTGIMTFRGIADVLEAMGASVLLLSISMKTLSKISWEDLSKGITAIGALLFMLTKVVDSLSSKKSKQMVSGTRGLIMMAASIRIITNALIKLSELSWEELAKGTSAISLLIVELAGFIKFTNDAKKMMSIGIGMVLLSTGIRILANAAKSFAEMSWEDLGKAGAAITALLTMLTALTKLTSSKFSISKNKDISGMSKTLTDTQNQLMSLGASMILIGVALKIIAKAAKSFAEMSWEDLGKAGAAITGLLGVLTAFDKFNGGRRSLANSSALIILGVALNLFAHSVSKLSEISWEGLARAASIIVIFFTAISGLADKLNEKRMMAISGGVAILSYALINLSIAVTILSKLSWGGILKAAVVLAGVFIGLGYAASTLEPFIGVIYALSGAIALFGLGVAALGIGVLALSAGLTALGGAVGVIGTVIGSFVKAIVSAIPQVLKALAEGIVEFIKTIGESAPEIGKTIRAILHQLLDSTKKMLPEIFGIVKSILDSVLPIISEYGPKIAETAFNLLINVIDVLIKKVPVILAKLMQLLQVIFGSLLKAIGNIDAETFVGAVAAFGVLIGLFVAMAAASKIIKSAMKTGLAMIVVFGLLTAMFLILNTIDATTLLTMALSLSGALVAITACMVVASMIPVAAAAQGIAGLAIVIGGLTAIIAAMGALKQIPGLKWLVDEGAVLLKSIGKAIGGFVGGIVGGFLEGMTDSLPKIADNLSDFMIRLTPFLAGIKLITPESMEAAQSLVGVILALTAAKILDGIASWITGGTDVSKFADDLVALAPAIVKYSETVAGKIAVKDVKASAVALLALSKMAGSLPRSGGLFEGIFGKSMSMKSFGKQMKSFGEAIVDYSNAVSNKNLDIKAIKASSSAGVAMSKLANNLPKSKGVAQFFTGEGMTLSKFGKELVDFAPHMVEYSKAVSGKKISVDAIKASANAGMALSKLANALPDYDGVAQFFGGHKIKLSDFGYEMAAFGIYFGKYAESIKDIKVETVTASANAAQALADLSNSLSETGGLGQLFGGKKDLSAFGQSLVDFGGYFSQYNNKIKDIKISDKVDQITEHMVGLVKLLDSIGESAFTDDKGETFKNGINTIAEANIEDFVNAFKSFYSDGDNAETLKTVGKNILMSIANGMLTNSEQLSGKVGDIASNMLKGLNNEMNDKTKHKTFKAALNWYKNELDSFDKKTKNTFKTLGSTIVKNWITGLETKENRFSFSSALGKYTTIIDTKGTKWTNRMTSIGKNIISGLTKGIKEYPKDQDPGDALVKIASNMITRFKKKLKIKSPSREMFGIGRFTISGLVNAIKQYGPLASNAMNDVANSIINTISTPLSNISDYLGSDFDDDPIIKPVLDLTDVQNGSKVISDLLSDSTYTLNGMAINGASIGGNIGITDESKIYNDSNVISEIESLRSDVKTLSESIKSLKIVLDTGETVGALSSSIDDSLGQIAMYKERGI